MVSIALLDDFIEASRASTVFSTHQVPSDDPLYKYLARELNDAVLCKPVAIVHVKNSVLERTFANTLQAFQNDGLPIHERYVYHATKATLQTVCEGGLMPQPDKYGFFGGPAVYLAETIKKANRYVRTFGDVSQVRALLRCRILLGSCKEYPIGHQNHRLRCAPDGFQSVRGFISNGYEYVVYSANQVLITDVIFYRVLSNNIDYSRMFLPSNFTGTVACIDPYLCFMFSNLANNTSLDRVTIYRLIYQLIARTLSLSEFLIVFSHALDHIYPNDIVVGKLENALAKSTLVLHYTDGIPCMFVDTASTGLMAFQLLF